MVGGGVAVNGPCERSKVSTKEGLPAMNIVPSYTTVLQSTSTIIV